MMKPPREGEGPDTICLAAETITQSLESPEETQRRLETEIADWKSTLLGILNDCRIDQTQYAELIELLNAYENAAAAEPSDIQLVANAQDRFRQCYERIRNS